jgi:CxxC motif-containing protein (DUF1111 family)
MNLNAARAPARLFGVLVAGLFLRVIFTSHVAAQSTAIDPGVRGGSIGAGQFYSGITANQLAFANAGKKNFGEINSVQQADSIGLGPRFDSNQCSNCHAQPSAGGTTGFNNGLFQVYDLDGATNYMPFFESFTGAALNARFPRQVENLSLPDNQVHQVFTITGRFDAGTCDVAQPDFTQASADSNLSFRAILPVFGDGLIEIINDRDIIGNRESQCAQEATTGICGAPSRASDGGIARFGWKAQNRSILIFSAEAYNVEEGVTTEAFPNEMDETPGCVINSLPEDHTDFTGTQPALNFTGDPDRFAHFARFLAPPIPAPGNASTLNGQTQFVAIGCAMCHTQSFVTPVSAIAVLSQVKANLYSDLLLHRMGPCLADGIVQGPAAGDMFRTPPLWGVGQRVFFLHDGRTSDIVQAVEDHFCESNGLYPVSEANITVTRFNALSAKNQQDLVNFLRSL